MGESGVVEKEGECTGRRLIDRRAMRYVCLQIRVTAGG